VEDNRKAQTTIVHLCDCSTHGLAVTRIDWNDDGTLVDVELALWRQGNHGECTCWQCRLRHIWYIMRYGHPYTSDWVSANRETARAIAAAILKAAE
jgi:hypothetical protein